MLRTNSLCQRCFQLIVIRLFVILVIRYKNLQIYDISVFKSTMPAEMTSIKNPSLKQGFLEASNVNIVNEMTDMIMAQRVFEGTQKAIHAYDQMADKLINVVGSVKG